MFDITVYAVGKPAPGINQYPGNQGCMIGLEMGLMILHLYQANLHPADIKAVSSGKLKYGVFTEAHIPVLLFGFPDSQFSFEVSLNIFKCPGDLRHEWFERDANMVMLALIEANNNIVKALRSFNADMVYVETIKQELRRQLELYPNYLQVDKTIEMMQKHYTQEHLLASAKMYDLPLAK